MASSEEEVVVEADVACGMVAEENEDERRECERPDAQHAYEVAEATRLAWRNADLKAEAEDAEEGDEQAQEDENWEHESAQQSTLWRAEVSGRGLRDAGNAPRSAVVRLMERETREHHITEEVQLNREMRKVRERAAPQQVVCFALVNLLSV
jgi:hypothetical protein